MLKVAEILVMIHIHHNVDKDNNNNNNNTDNTNKESDSNEHPEHCKKAGEIFEKVGVAAIDGVTRFGVRGHFLNAGICFLAFDVISAK